MILRLALLLTALATLATASAREAVEGEWRIAGSGVEFAVTASPTEADVCDITLLDATDMSLLPGTRIGTLRRTPVAGRYVARMVVDPSRPLGRKRDMLVQLTDQGTLTFRPYSKGRRISLWRWIPYLFRVTVVESGREPDDINGAVRRGYDDLSRHRAL